MWKEKGGQGWKQEAPPGANPEHGDGDPSLLEDPGYFPARGSPLLPAWQRWAQAWLVPIGQRACP